MLNFNEYNDSLDTEGFSGFVRREGERVRFEKGEIFTCVGEVPSRLGWAETGAFSYVCSNSEGKEYNVGFSFAGEAVVDYFNFLNGTPSEVDVKAITRSDVLVVSRKRCMEFQAATMENMRFVKLASEALGSQIYNRLLSLYMDTAEERYNHLSSRCPNIFEILSLKEIASFLRVTPETVSHIRRRLLK